MRDATDINFTMPQIGVLVQLTSYSIIYVSDDGI